MWRVSQGTDLIPVFKGQQPTQEARFQGDTREAGEIIIRLRDILAEFEAANVQVHYFEHPHPCSAPNLPRYTNTLFPTEG